MFYLDRELPSHIRKKLVLFCAVWYSTSSRLAMMQSYFEPLIARTPCTSCILKTDCQNCGSDHIFQTNRTTELLFVIIISINWDYVLGKN